MPLRPRNAGPYSSPAAARSRYSSTASSGTPADARNTSGDVDAAAPAETMDDGSGPRGRARTNPFTCTRLLPAPSPPAVPSPTPPSLPPRWP
eukprot:363041-Chlamydomonas_euryale.AAC.4